MLRRLLRLRDRLSPFIRLYNATRLIYSTKSHPFQFPNLTPAGKALQNVKWILRRLLRLRDGLTPPPYPDLDLTPPPDPFQNLPKLGKLRGLKGRSWPQISTLNQDYSNNHSKFQKYGLGDPSWNFSEKVFWEKMLTLTPQILKHTRNLLKIST